MGRFADALATPGLGAIAEIKRRNPEIRILVLTLHRTEEYIHQSLKAGADGHMLKDATHDELRVAIRSVLNGKTYLSPDISNQIDAAMRLRQLLLNFAQ